MSFDIGEICVHCRESVALGGGKFVNRYPVYGLYNEELDREEDGYCCAQCEEEFYRDAGVVCNDCGTLYLDGNDSCIECGSHSRKPYKESEVQG